MTDGNQPRTAKPESLEAKFKLLALLPYDRRAKRKHSLVFGFILDWYHSKYGDALASVRHVTATIKERDPGGTGLYAGDVHCALSDLVAWGYLEQEKGTGRRASRYVPVWSKLDSVHKTPNATDDEISVRENANASVRETPNAKPDSVRDSMNEDPLTVTRPQDRVNGKEGYDCATPTAPPAPPAIAADAAVSAQGEYEAVQPFEQLWRAYDYKKKKKEARAAYAKLAPDNNLHAEMVKAAEAWRESWAAQSNPEAPRFHLHKWIEREEYECSPPTAYKPKERKARAATSEQPAVAKAKGKLTEPLRVIEAEYIGSAFSDYRLRLKVDAPSGEQEHTLKILTDAGQGEDNDVFVKLRAAFKLDAADWPGQRLRLKVDDGRIVDAVPELQPDRLVKIAEADIVDVDQDKIFVAKLVDMQGKPEGRLDIIIRSDDFDEQREGQAKATRLFDAVDLGASADAESDDLIGRVFMFTGKGDFKRAPANMVEAA